MDTFRDRDGVRSHDRGTPTENGRDRILPYATTGQQACESEGNTHTDKNRERRHWQNDTGSQAVEPPQRMEGTEYSHTTLGDSMHAYTAKMPPPPLEADEIIDLVTPTEEENPQFPQKMEGTEYSHTKLEHSQHAYQAKLEREKEEREKEEREKEEREKEEREKEEREKEEEAPERRKGGEKGHEGNPTRKEDQRFTKERRRQGG
ncbi:hypothetical protein BDZ91DRAFT_813855 [Kalaharituber pfeilii]|nr:hypothetical protein BDZ91DRAFT_813855 [Kalaharituber pfeilii]